MGLAIKKKIKFCATDIFIFFSFCLRMNKLFVSVFCTFKNIYFLFNNICLGGTQPIQNFNILFHKINFLNSIKKMYFYPISHVF